MILKGNRQEEILTRAKSRNVFAFIYASVPGIDPKTTISSLGVIVKDSMPALGVSDTPHMQTSLCWHQDDVCEPLVETDPIVFAQVIENVARRTKLLKTGQLGNLDFAEQRAAFDSEDLVAKATGIPSRFNIDFKNAAGIINEISKVPFPKLQNFLVHLAGKLSDIGGAIHSAAIAHHSAMSAFDYYELTSEKYTPGKKFSYGDVMLARGYNLLKDVGLPLVQPVRARSLH